MRKKKRSLTDLAVSEECLVVEDTADSPVGMTGLALLVHGRVRGVDGGVRVAVACQALPEGGVTVCGQRHDPRVTRAFVLGAHADVGVQPEAQEEGAEEDGMVLTVTLRRERGVL